MGESERALDSTTRWLARLVDIYRSDQFTLNFAGPRERESPGIYQLAFAFIEELLG
jgi:hypothetical protein